ncbi:MAG: hypothetical protein WCE73_05385 [Candidatus Angelobacter sp.]
MSTTVVHRELTRRSAPAVSEMKQAPNASSWETLCGWLTRDLRGMMTTIERREKGGDWVVECRSFPMESVTTRMTSNGVRVISVGIRINGSCKLFEISGPNSIGLRRNAAGWPIRVELGYEEGQLVLLFSGQMDPERRSSRNTWGE